MAPSARMALALACLGGIAILIGSVAVTLQILVIQKKNVLALKQKQNSNFKSKSKSTQPTEHPSDNSTSSTAFVWETIQPSHPTKPSDIWKYRHSHSPPPPEISTAHAFWNQVQPYLQSWDATFEDYDSTSFEGGGRDTFTTTFTHNLHSHEVIYALRQAAQLGHPQAQYYMATALASGIWPLAVSPSPSSTTTSTPTNNNDNYKLDIHDDMIPSFPNQTQALESYILYRMAALQGHVDASLALGYRILLQYIQTKENGGSSNKEIHRDDGSSTSSRTSLDTTVIPPSICQAALPYYENAVHHIMDQLEVSSMSRTKVNPPMDPHILSQIHMHGGTSSQLPMSQKPDESSEALQYYHLRATSSSSSSSSSSFSSSDAADDIDVHAAYTLANLYHYGLRGVVQNLTLALQYYEIAAHANHWEAAGQAGKFYFWGLGTDPPNYHKAKQYFEQGSPFGLEGCIQQYKAQRKLMTAKPSSKNNNNDDNDNGDGDTEKDSHDDSGDGDGGGGSSSSSSSSSSSGSSSSSSANIVQCDHPSLNGMGLLHLYGIKNHMPVNIERARRYFTLSKQAGNMDAAYNLAMMTLGWKTHYQLEQENHQEEQEKSGKGSSSSSSSHEEEEEEDANNGNDDDDDERQTHSPTTRETISPVAKHPQTPHKKNTIPTEPSRNAYTSAITDLIFASNKGHIQAKHRLGMIYQYGIALTPREDATQLNNRNEDLPDAEVTEHPDGSTTTTFTYYAHQHADNLNDHKNAETVTKTKQIVPPDCNKALHQYRYIIDNASPTLSVRTRKAYKYYMAGEYEKSLRNYLLAAESGSEVGQVNAAFLMERGECLGLTDYQCAKAAVRLYKAAAVLGNAEASLRVGDFYYYGRLRNYYSSITRSATRTTTKTTIPVEKEMDGENEDEDESDSSAFLWDKDMMSSFWFSSLQHHGVLSSPGPFGWINYFVYPEKVLLPLFWNGVQLVSETISGHAKDTGTTTSPMDAEQQQQPQQQEEEYTSSSRQSDLAMAAHYFRQAAERKNNPRANFNLGFMYEWGLGVKQDFPLAKRHYDLAAPSSSYTKEAEVPVQIALTILSFHEKFVKFQMAYNVNGGDDDEGMAFFLFWRGNRTKSKRSIFVSHLLNWESAMILVLTWALLKIFRRRQQQQQQQHE